MIPRQFKDTRKALGLTQSQMAVYLRLNSGRAVRAYELGEREISGPISKLMEIYKAFPVMMQD